LNRRLYLSPEGRISERRLINKSIEKIGGYNKVWFADGLDGFGMNLALCFCILNKSSSVFLLRRPTANRLAVYF
jgi:hypothetical protein